MKTLFFMKKSTITFIILGILIILIILGTFIKMAKSETINVKIETNMGNISLELDKAHAPITVENFLKYVNSSFYTNTTFHRIIENFMIQGGGMDLNGNEKQTYAPIKLESKNGLKNLRGTVAMARTMIPDSATSQFFINTRDNDFLNYGFRDEGYAVFGKVTSGMDVVDKIAAVEVDGEDKPLKDVVILKVSLIN
jgi:peptidyl-prolyl cis-trans isomerase A (cyclophilin A)